MFRSLNFLRSLAKCPLRSCSVDNSFLSNVRIGSSYVAVQSKAQYSTNPDFPYTDEPYEIFHQRFLNAFNNPKIDGWWLRRWLELLHLEDAIPPPDVVCSALKACRRNNDIALAIRFLESCRLKCEMVKGSWKWLQSEIEPTMKELGIPTLKELNYEEPELWLEYKRFDGVH